MVAALRRLDGALPPHADLSLWRKRRVDAQVRLLRRGGHGDRDRGIDARRHERLEAGAGMVGAREASGPARRVEELPGRDGLPRSQVAEARVGRVVPEDAVAAAGDEERHDHRRVALPEIEVVALEVEETELLLAEAVERLAVGRPPLLPDVESLLALHLGRHQGAPALLLDENLFAPRVEERHLSRAEVHADLHLRCGQRRLAPGVGALDLHRLAATHAGGEARAGEEGGVAGEGHAYHVVGTEGHLQVAAADRENEAIGGTGAAQGRGAQQGRQDGGGNEEAGVPIHDVLQTTGQSPGVRRGSRTPLGCGRLPWRDSRRRRRGRGGRRGRSARRRSPRHPG